MADPPATWVLNLGVTALGGLVLLVLIAGAVRGRKLTWWQLISLSSASCFWLETFGDWGQHLSYSPRFAHYVLD